MSNVIEFNPLKRQLEACIEEPIEIAGIINRGEPAVVYMMQGDDCIMFPPDAIKEIIEHLNSAKDKANE